MKKTGAEILVQALIDQGCDTVFGYPGGFVLDIYDELYRRAGEISHVITAHEQGAAHAADGYARTTGKAGVVIATSGPGATNLVTGIATAHLDSTPLVVITGNVPLTLLGRDSFQEVDTMSITMPVTKHNYIVKTVESLAPTICEAFTIARSGRPGPVLIDIPKNIQLDSCEYAGMSPCAPEAMPEVSDEELNAVAELIKAAERPFIYCGGGAVTAGCGPEIEALSELICAPIGQSMMGLSAIRDDHPLRLGMAGMHGHFAATKAKSEADLVIAVGVRFSDRATGNKAKYSKSAKIIHFDIDPAEIDKNILVYRGIIGNVKSALARLTEKLSPAPRPKWLARVREMRKTEEENLPPSDGYNPRGIIRTVCERAGARAVYATDVGQHQMWAAQYCKINFPGGFLTSGGLGTMGFGMGAAIGGSVGRGRERAVLFTGDGSFGMNLNELATAVSQDLPLTVVIFNNGTLGMVRQWQTMFYGGRYSQTTLDRKTDFVKLAEAFGARGFRAGDLAELKAALDGAMSAPGPAVIDCAIGMDERVLPMIPPGGSIDEIILK